MNSCASARSAAAIICVVVCVRPAVDDVVAHRAVQQRGVLRDHADLRAQAVLLHVRRCPGRRSGCGRPRRRRSAAAGSRSCSCPRPNGRRGRSSRPAGCAARSPRSRDAGRRSGTARARGGSRRAAPRARGAPGRSTTAWRRDSVPMPSCTVPMFSNRLASSHMIQCAMPFSRSAIAVAAATAPTPTWPFVHSHSASAGGARRRAPC